ncbi:hypothetical protein MBANPS3_011616 [Mucor bainieri]
MTDLVATGDVNNATTINPLKTPSLFRIQDTSRYRLTKEEEKMFVEQDERVVQALANKKKAQDDIRSRHPNTKVQDLPDPENELWSKHNVLYKNSKRHARITQVYRKMKELQTLATECLVIDNATGRVSVDEAVLDRHEGMDVEQDNVAQSQMEDIANQKENYDSSQHEELYNDNHEEIEERDEEDEVEEALFQAEMDIYKEEAQLFPQEIGAAAISPSSATWLLRPYDEWNPSLIENALMNRTNLDGVEGKTIANEYRRNLIESVATLQDHWVFMASFLLFMPNNSQIDDCADLSLRRKYGSARQASCCKGHCTRRPHFNLHQQDIIRDTGHKRKFQERYNQDKGRSQKRPTRSIAKLNELMSLTVVSLLKMISQLASFNSQQHKIMTIGTGCQILLTLVTLSKKQTVHQALSEVQIKQYRSEMRMKFAIDQVVVDFSRHVIKAFNNKPTMGELKDTKAFIKALPNSNRQTLLKAAVNKRELLFAQLTITSVQLLN